MERDPLGVAGVELTSGYVDTGTGARLRLLEWRAPGARGRPIVFVPGWVSVLEGWLELLRVLVREHPVYYLETREKSSAELAAPRRDDFRIASMAVELRGALAAMGIDVGEAVIAGSSLGASIIVEAMKHRQLRPHAAFLIGPTCHFRFPWWGHGVMVLPVFLYGIVKYFVRWYLRTFRVDAEREPEQMRRYDRTLDIADPRRLKLSAKAVAGFTLWRDLATVGVPVGVAYAPSDTLHGAADMERLIAELPRATAIPCPSNKHMHSAALAPDLERFLASLRA